MGTPPIIIKLFLLINHSDYNIMASKFELCSKHVYQKVVPYNVHIQVGNINFFTSQQEVRLIFLNCQFFSNYVLKNQMSYCLIIETLIIWKLITFTFSATSINIASAKTTLEIWKFPNIALCLEINFVLQQLMKTLGLNDFSIR